MTLGSNGMSKKSNNARVVSSGAAAILSSLRSNKTPGGSEFLSCFVVTVASMIERESCASGKNQCETTSQLNIPADRYVPPVVHGALV
jgi:hypothetical protein